MLLLAVLAVIGALVVVSIWLNVRQWRINTRVSEKRTLSKVRRPSIAEIRSALSKLPDVIKRDVPIFLRKGLLPLLCMFALLALFVIDPEKLPNSVFLSIVMLLVLAFTIPYLIWKLVVAYIVNNTGKSLYMAILGTTTVLGGAYFTFLGGLADTAVQNHLHISTVMFTILILFTPTIPASKLLMESMKNAKAIGFIGIVLFFVTELCLLVAFGYYNLSHPHYLTQTNPPSLLDTFHDLYDMSLLPRVIKLIHYGAEVAFSIQAATKATGTAPILEFLTITFYNMIVVGFLLAYVTTMMLERRSKKQTA